VEVGTSALSLRDPLSMAPITIPVRGQWCAHLESFDLSTYLSSNTGAAAKWQCPRCRDVVVPSALCVDTYMLGIMRTLAGGRTSGAGAAAEVLVPGLAAAPGLMPTVLRESVGAGAPAGASAGWGAFGVAEAGVTLPAHVATTTARVHLQRDLSWHVEDTAALKPAAGGAGAAAAVSGSPAALPRLDGVDREDAYESDDDDGGYAAAMAAAAAAATGHKRLRPQDSYRAADGAPSAQRLRVAGPPSPSLPPPPRNTPSLPPGALVIDLLEEEAPAQKSGPGIPSVHMAQPQGPRL
jgi:hypothetical protein